MVHAPDLKSVSLPAGSRWSTKPLKTQIIHARLSITCVAFLDLFVTRLVCVGSNPTRASTYFMAR